MIDKKMIEDYAHVEEDFFAIDRKNKTATVKFAFHTPSDIFDGSFQTKTPVLSDEFLSKLSSLFELIPKKYSVNLEVCFDDMQGLSSRTLTDIFIKNVYFAGKADANRLRARVYSSVGLILIGALLFGVLILLENLAVGRIFQILTETAMTVSFWEAVCLLIVEGKERGDKLNDIRKRFASITFTSCGQNQVIT